MHPRLSLRSVCRRRLVGDPHRGFTLVELLVVIAIIAMLVGLLVPAVMRAREAGRRATCLNNQQQIGKAIMSYVTAKDKFPPLFSPQPVLTPLRAVGWVPPMLPYLEQNPLYQVFQSGTWLTANVQNAEVATLICPSRNPTNSPAPLSYIVNAGVTDYFTSPTTTQPMDYQENGIFFDDYAWRLNSPPTLPKPPQTDLSYVNMHDGTSMTLMVSENTDALDWITLPNSGTYSPQQPNYSSNNIYVESWWQSMTWTVGQVVGSQPPFPPVPLPLWGSANNPPTGQVLNKQPSSVPPSPSPEDLNFLFGRPSSNHPGGFIVTMCDASSRFMSEDVEYRVYCLLMSPSGQGANNPRTGMPVVYPQTWAPLPAGTLTPITETDLNP